MSTVEVMKEQARRHEQNEEWRKALEIYQRAIDRLQVDDDPDIGLYNRVGDLYIRVGELDPAVKSFERAVELYSEAQLPNNAIAVCKKILRNVPDRHEVHLRMGQIRAAQGFLVDARSHFLHYAERMQAAGELDEALRALVEFADAAPEDTGIRLAIAGHFEQHDRPDEAVEQLARGLRSALDQGLDDHAATFRERLAALRPDDDPDALADEVGAPPSETTADDDAPVPGFETTALGGLDDGTPASASAVEEAVEEAAGAPEDGPPPLESWDYGDIHPLDETPPEALDQPLEEGLDEGLEEGLDETVDEARDEGSAGMAQGFDDALSSIGPDVSGFGRAEDAHNPLEGLDLALPGATYENEDDDDDYGAVDLPLMTFHDDGEVADLSVVPVAEDREEEAAPVDEGPAVSDPDDLEALQRAVEAAHRTGDDRALAEAYVGLGEALRRSGAEVRARAVFREALQLDPVNRPAQAALAESPETEVASTAEVASSEDYVDLGALILGDEDHRTTRFVVAYEEPSGDEDADFAKMLSQFKAKVAENFDASDVTGHHDLGTAYKEMGLLDEAVQEFQAALRASPEHLATYEALGQTFMERGTPEAAVRVLTRALEVPFEVEDELLGIYYYMGRSHEDLGNTGQAREFYERVFSLDINFADVTERLRALR